MKVNVQYLKTMDDAVKLIQDLGIPYQLADISIKLTGPQHAAMSKMDGDPTFPNLCLTSFVGQT